MTHSDYIERAKEIITVAAEELARISFNNIFDYDGIMCREDADKVLCRVKDQIHDLRKLGK